MIFNKITGLLNSNAVRQGTVVIFDQGMMSLVTFVAGIFIARSSSEQDYALYMLGWTLLLSIKGIQEALVNLPFTVFAPRLTGSRLKSYQGSAIIHTLLFCLVLCIVLFAVSFFKDISALISYYDLFELVPLLLFLLVSFVFRDFLRNTLLAQLSVWASVRINGFASIFLIISIFLLFYTHKLTVFNTYLVFSLVFSIAALLMFWQHRFDYVVDRRELWSHFLDNWKLGKWALVGNFAFTGSRSSYPWLILYFLDFQSVAAYYACLALALAPGPLLRGTGAYILPRMSHSYKEGALVSLLKMLKKAIVILCLPYLIWLLLCALFSDEIIHFFYIDKFKGYGVLFVLLTLTATIDFVFAPLTNALQVLEKTREITISLIIGAFFTLTLGVLLIKEFGLYGAGFSSVISMSATIGWRVWALTRNTSDSAV